MELREVKSFRVTFTEKELKALVEVSDILEDIQKLLTEVRKTRSFASLYDESNEEFDLYLTKDIIDKLAFTYVKIE